MSGPGLDRRPRGFDIPGGRSRGVVAGRAREWWRIRPMQSQSRRGFLIKLAAGFAAMALVVVGTVIADELLGVITKVDIEGKQITVEEKDTDKEIKIKITDDTVQVTKKGEVKVDLEKLEAKVKKIQDAGKKGVMAKITHEKRTASKIEYPKKKAD
jgi:hypothetical protein